VKNYWIFQSNPRIFPIKQEITNAFSEKLPEKYRGVAYWHIEKIPNNPNKKIMRPEDIVFIWKSDGDDKDTRGIYAKARIISIPPHKEPYTEDRIDKTYKEAELYEGFIDPSAEKNKEQWPHVIIEYTQNLIETPLLAQQFKWMAEFENLLILKFFQKTLYDDVTEEQGRILEGMADWSCKAESLRRNSSRVGGDMNKFTVSLPKISFDEAQHQAVKKGFTLNDLIIRVINRFINKEKVYEEMEYYVKMGDEDKIAYVKNLLKERREIGIARYDDEKELDDAVKSGDYKIGLLFHSLNQWLFEKYELVYPSGYKW